MLIHIEFIKYLYSGEKLNTSSYVRLSTIMIIIYVPMKYFSLLKSILDSGKALCHFSSRHEEGARC